MYFSRLLNFANAAGSSPPCFSTLSLARARNWSRLHACPATPITGMFRLPRFAIACKAGKIFLYARSPVAPKNTRASECISLIVPSSRDLLEMSAESESHRREELVLIICVTARGEAFIERRGENRGRHCLVDCGLDGPPAFAGVRHAAGEFFEFGIFDQRRRRQIEQPRSDDAAPSPHLGDLAQVQVV